MSRSRMKPVNIAVVATVLLAALSVSFFTRNEKLTVIIQPERVMQGEPLMITVSGRSKTSEVTSILFDGKQIPFFLHDESPAALIGIDLNAKTGTSSLVVTLSDGSRLMREIAVTARRKEKAPLGIPQKLGGNTATSQRKLVTTLETENKLLENISSENKKLWSGSFILPLTKTVVVDHFGYTRQTGGYTIAHKGTDFRASEGTLVHAMNGGIIRLARYSPVYGNMVVVDHGLNLMTFYMHLSKLNVATDQLVEKGQLLGLSGQTGYALGAHLHLSVRINNVSIDPMKFMEFFK